MAQHTFGNVDHMMFGRKRRQQKLIELVQFVDLFVDVQAVAQRCQRRDGDVNVATLAQAHQIDEIVAHVRQCRTVQYVHRANVDDQFHAIAIGIVAQAGDRIANRLARYA